MLMQSRDILASKFAEFLEILAGSLAGVQGNGHNCGKNEASGLDHGPQPSLLRFEQAGKGDRNG